MAKLFADALQSNACSLTLHHPPSWYAKTGTTVDKLGLVLALQVSANYVMLTSLTSQNFIHHIFSYLLFFIVSL